MNITRQGKRLLSGLLGLTVAAGLAGTVCLAQPETEEDLFNAAAGKPAFTTSSYDDSVWGAAYLTDGHKMGSWPLPAGETLGWRTNNFLTGTGEDGRDTDVTVTVNLEEESDIRRILLYPRGNGGICFPAAYTVEVSADGADWTSVAAVTGDTEIEGKVRTFDAQVTGRFVRVHITRLSAGRDGTEQAAEISEIEVLAEKRSRPRRNVAHGAQVTSSSSYRSDIATVWQESNLTNGDVMASWPLAGVRDLGWRSYPLADREQKVTLDLTLEDTFPVDEIVLYPRGNGGICFPAAYTVSLSADGQTYTPVVQVEQDALTGERPRSHTFAETRARYARIELTRASANLDGAEIAYELSEIQLWGKAETKLKLDKPEIWLSVGESDRITAALTDSEETPQLAFRVTGERGIIDLGGDGTFTAKRNGDTVVQVTDTVTGASADLSVKVYAEQPDNILISVPVWGNEKAITEEQFCLLRDADVDAVMAVGHDMRADLAQKIRQTARAIWDDGRSRNLRVFDYVYVDGITQNSTDEQIAAYLDRHRNTPALIGYHIEDEPVRPNEYARLSRLLRAGDTDAIADLNFLPGIALGSYGAFTRALNDYAALAQASYLSFDNYPFLPEAGSVDETSLFGNFEAMRKAGLASDVPTAFYVQGVGSDTFRYRRPDEAVLRYHLASAMAYGFKWVKYFSWYVPGIGTGEENMFTDAIMDKNFEKTELYDIAAQLNRQIHNVGGILARTDAAEVFHTGTVPGGCRGVDSRFFAQPVGDARMILSLMVDRTDGKQYLMVVNKDLAASKTFSLRLEGIDAVTECDKDTAGGTLAADYRDGVLTRSYLPGEFALFRLTTDKDLRVTKTAAGESRNLLLDAKTTASGSVGRDGWYIGAANDGKRSAERGIYGWKETKDVVSDSFITFDMGRLRDIDRIDLYPAGSGAGVGHLFPDKISVWLSADGEQWTRVAEQNGIDRPMTAVPVIRFATTAARYVKIVAHDCLSVAIAEIEGYRDDGTVPLPQPTSYVPPQTDPQQNLARGKEAQASAAYRDSAWDPARLTDGVKMTSWPTDRGLGYCAFSMERDTQVWFQVDLEAEYTVNEVVLYPRGNGGICFPADYQIQVSTDGIHFTTVYTKTGDENCGETPRVIAFDGVPAAYVRVLVTKLSDEPDGAFYTCQVSEIEVYDRRALRGIRLEKAPDKTDYVEGERFDPAGMEIWADYDRAASARVTDLVFLPDRPLQVGDTAVTVSYTAFGETMSVSVPIRVTAKPAGGDPDTPDAPAVPDEPNAPATGVAAAGAAACTLAAGSAAACAVLRKKRGRK